MVNLKIVGRDAKPIILLDKIGFQYFLGVRIIPEFDAPAHVGYGWQYPGAENFTVCLDKQPWLVNNITMGSKTL